MPAIASQTAGASVSSQVKQATEVVSRQVTRRAQRTIEEFSTSFRRLSKLTPGYVRLGRWKARRWLARSLAPRNFQLAFPVSVALGTTLSCGLWSNEGGDGGLSNVLTPLPPELSKTKGAPSEARPEAPWTYVLPVDHGVRADGSGKGHFRAPRFHGEHNGLDLLAPVGTPTFSACDGQAMAGVSASFGRWVHVICPLPEAFVKKGEPTPWASFFYAHLDRLDLELDRWLDVGRGQKLGVVGKTGNARGPNVQPHLHLELIVQKNRRAAMDERHLGRDQSAVGAADFFAEKLDDTCLSPRGFQPKSKQILRARRVDPFVALVCLSPEKPNFVKAPEPLEFASAAWSDFYVAKEFNVNRGPSSSKGR